MSTAPSTRKGSRLNRFVIRFFSLILVVLVFWLLGFLVRDIRAMKGPDYQEIEKRHVNQAQIDHQIETAGKLGDVKRAIDKRQAAKKAIGDSTRGLEKTIGQLIELQRLGIEKEKAFSAEEQAAFADNLKLFLENQKRDQSLGQEIVGLVEERTDLEQQQRDGEAELQRQRQPAQEEYRELVAAHKLRLAMYQLLVLSPFLAVATWLCVRKRSSPYFPIYVAVAAAALIQVGLVLHRYFPNRLFKYGFLFVLLAVVLRLLIHLIRNAVNPARDTLLKQYREAYERFRCPNCEYPIRRGPMRFATWSRKTVKNLTGGKLDEDQPYVCPSCGTQLFEECTACHQVRPALLPHCDHCGIESKE